MSALTLCTIHILKCVIFLGWYQSARSTSRKCSIFLSKFFRQLSDERLWWLWTLWFVSMSVFYAWVSVCTQSSLPKTLLFSAGFDVYQIPFEVSHTLVFTLLLDGCPSWNGFLKFKVVILFVLFAFSLSLLFLLVRLLLFLLNLLLDLVHVTKFVKCIFL